MANDWRRPNRHPSFESIPFIHINKSGLADELREMFKDKEIKAGIVAGTGNHQGADIPIRATACHYGGYRFWFVCNGCDGNRLVLRYLEKENKFFCNKCLSGVHRITQMSKADRRFNRRANIRERLGLERHHGLMHRIICIDKPKHMHWKTFTPLMQEHNWLLHIDSQKWMAASIRVFPHMADLLQR